MRILNIGAGEDDYGTDFVDLYPQREEVCKVDIDEDKLPYEDSKFDEVYSKCVFEHLTNLGHAVSEMKRVCKDQGEIIIITDNANYWRFSAENTEHTGDGYKGTGYGESDQHHALFTGKHLSNLFKQNNIEVQEIEYLEGGDGFFERFLDFLLRRTSFYRAAYKRIKIRGSPE